MLNYSVAELRLLLRYFAKVEKSSLSQLLILYLSISIPFVLLLRLSLMPKFFVDLSVCPMWNLRQLTGEINKQRKRSTANTMQPMTK